ncbi:MAG: hypothetical protein A2808_00830 [Candidatus Moranbacteria bacterium RIFCSPHIGHO2_01_FULL_55_24]|nr:MAG: hypothetical protein A2808_00830 [Candidatus Moranbacteria bacterium RIFCSPHIGHO2_01_FULL_55_24]
MRKVARRRVFGERPGGLLWDGVSKEAGGETVKISIERDNTIHNLVPFRNDRGFSFIQAIFSVDNFCVDG